MGGIPTNFAWRDSVHLASKWIEPYPPMSQSIFVRGMLLQLSTLIVFSLLAGCQDVDTLRVQPNQSRVDLSQEIQGNWTRVCVIGPYSDNEQASRIVGFAIDVERPSDIERSDAIVLIAVIDAEQSASLLRVERNIADFAALSGECFRRTQAVFRIGGDGAVSPRRESRPPVQAVYACDKRHLDATCIQFSVGNMFESEAEIQSHCSKLGLGGVQPIFRPGWRCPANDRVGRCVDAQGLLASEKVYGTVHYYGGLNDRWDWAVEGFSPACSKLGGQLSID